MVTLSGCLMSQDLLFQISALFIRPLHGQPVIYRLTILLKKKKKALCENEFLCASGSDQLLLLSVKTKMENPQVGLVERTVESLKTCSVNFSSLKLHVLLAFSVVLGHTR